ncbi:MAG: class I SAM-dependent methyltransferase [Acidimicrobiales bacterium]
MNRPDPAARRAPGPDPTAAAGPAAYGDVFAPVYDLWYAGVTDAEATARFVADRAASGPVLELGVGTGRLAVPLVRAGRTVIGLDASAAMLGRGRAAHPGARIRWARADMAALPLAAGTCGGVLVAYNTLFNLGTGAAQAAAVAEAARVLRPGGILVVEALVPAGIGAAAGPSLAPGPPRPAPVGRGSRATEAAMMVTAVATVVDQDRQTIAGCHVAVDDHGVELFPWLVRWSTPDQIDGYAARAGLVRTERYGDWVGGPSSPAGGIHVSVYRRPPSVP